ncbi:MAG: tetratricopeptide repeat protein [Deltaproteobacteria bacterium]|nr:tetratricopeptide repeat protein [Candidatus Zymogenaceae bacterium]
MKRSLTWITLLSLLLVSSAALCQEDPLKAKVVEIEKAYIAGDLAAIVTKYEALAAENPNDAAGRYLLGIAYLYADFTKETATFDKSFDEFIKAKTLDPKMKYVNNSLAYVFWARGQYDKAIEFYKAEIALDPTYGWNYYNLGKAYADLKQWDKAKSQYIIAIDKEKKDPRIAKAYNNLGEIYMEWYGDYFKALDNFKKAVELKPTERLYIENYNVTIKKLRDLKDSLDKGQTNLPPETVDRLKKMDLKEIEIDTEGT